MVVTGTLGSLLGSAALVGWLAVCRVERDGGAALALRDVGHLVGGRRRRPIDAERPAAIWTWPDPYGVPGPAPSHGA